MNRLYIWYTPPPPGPRGKRTHTVMLVKNLHQNIHATRFECFFFPLSPIVPVFTSYFSCLCVPLAIYTHMKHISDESELGTQHRIEGLHDHICHLAALSFFASFFGGQDVAKVLRTAQPQGATPSGRSIAPTITSPR
jgi:hypothetical protein